MTMCFNTQNKHMNRRKMYLMSTSDYVS